MSGSPGNLYLAFDFGSQSIGVAAGSATGGAPTPLSVVRVFRSGPDWNAIDKLVNEWRPAGLVVGIALNWRGEDTPFSGRARRFGHQLGRRYRLPVHWVDETLTTEAARQALRAVDSTARTRKPDIDNAAAALILESFLEARQ